MVRRLDPLKGVAGGEPLRTAWLRNRTLNLGKVTSNIRPLTLMRMSFTVADYLQVVRGYSAMETGEIFTCF